MLTNFDSIPDALKQTTQFLCFDCDKKPISAATGKRKDWQNNLSNYETAKRFAEQHGLGIGFAFNSQTDFFGVDLDGCVDPKTGTIEPWAIAIVLLTASHCELSISRTGLHIICRGNAPNKLKAVDFGDVKHGKHRQQAEFKACSGYLALTGILHSSLPKFGLQKTNLLGIHERITIYQRALKYLREVPPAIEGQGGDAATFTVACSLVHGFNLSPSETLFLIHEWNKRCVPPWIETDLKHKLAEAHKREDGQGRSRGYLLRPKFDTSIVEGWAEREYEKFLASNNNDTKQQTHPDQYVPFPTDLLPYPLNAFVHEGSASIGCDASYLALPMLSALAAAIGDSRQLVVKDDWRVLPIIWTAVIGESGTAKSPAYRMVMKYPKQHQASLQKSNGDDQREYEKQLDIYESELKHWKGKRSWNGGIERPLEPKQPRNLRTTASDATLEALIGILRDNPRGLLVEFGELAGWAGSLDKYRSGGDAAAWLMMYDGDTLTVDRQGAGHSHIPRAIVSITGGIQPGILTTCFTANHRASGLMVRFLIVHPPRVARRWREELLSAETDALMSRVFGYCYSLLPIIDSEDNRDPYCLTLSAEAKQLAIQFVNSHGMEQLDTFGELAASYSKHLERPFRLAIVFHCIKEAMGVTTDHQIDIETMRCAIALTEWFKNESRRIIATMTLDTQQTDQQKLIALIKKHDGVVKPRILQRSNNNRYPTSVAAEAALQELVDTGLGEWETIEPPTTGGKASKQFRLAT